MPRSRAIDFAFHQGLQTFAEEYASAKEIVVEEVPLRILALRRIIASERAAGRARDLAQIPALEEALAALDE